MRSQRKTGIELWLALKEAFHSFEACSMSQCSMKDKETKALKYTLTGIPDAASSWRTKEKKITNNHPRTFPWEQQCKPRNPHTWVSWHLVHTAKGGDCPTNVGVRPAISQIFCCMASSVRWFNLPPCRPALRGTHWHPSPSLMGYVGLCTYAQMYRLTPTCSYCVQAHFIYRLQTHRLFICSSSLVFVI